MFLLGTAGMTEPVRDAEALQQARDSAADSVRMLDAQLAVLKRVRAKMGGPSDLEEPH